MNEEKKWVKIFLQNGFIFHGELLEENDISIRIIDAKTGNQRLLMLSQISNVEYYDSQRFMRNFSCDGADQGEGEIPGEKKRYVG